VNSTQLTLTIINTGVLPSRIRFVLLTFGRGKRVTLGAMNPFGDADNVNGATLQHGDEIMFTIDISSGTGPWLSLPIAWWLRRHLRFKVYTSLGIIYVPLSVKHGRWLQKNVLRSIGAS
jgi:hypothetical protein